MNTISSQSVSEWRRQSKCVRCKYRMRWFSSKGAFLVLAWVLLLCVTITSSMKMIRDLSQRLQLTSESRYHWMSIAAIPSLIGVITLILSGWLADAKLGNFKVARFGFFLVFIATLCGSVYTCLLELPIATNLYFMLIFWCTVISIMAIGVTGIFATSLQLGLNQIPDASSSQITSFIAWFVFCLYAGSWISDLAYFFLGIGDSEGIEYEPDFNSRIQLWSLLPVLCMAIILILYFLLPNNWLIIERSIFKRIGLASFLITATSVLFLVVEIIRNFWGDYEHVAEWITIVSFERLAHTATVLCTTGVGLCSSSLQHERAFRCLHDASYFDIRFAWRNFQGLF